MQGCTGTSARILAEALVGALLVAGLGKGDQRVTVQLAGGGPMRGLFTEGSADGKVRGYVQGFRVHFPGGEANLHAAIGRDGYLSLLRDLPNGEFYRASVPLDDPRLDRNLEQYFATSEQVPTTVAIEAELDEAGAIARAVGFLVQRLPGGDTAAVESIRERIRKRPLLGAREEEKGGMRLVLPYLEGLGELEILEDTPIEWRCRCSRERARRGLAGAGVDELLDMVAKDRGAELSCEFCRTVYRFDAEELLQIVDEIQQSSPKGEA